MPSLESIRFAQEEDTLAAETAGDVARSAHGRADAVVTSLPERLLWACRAGCAACCHLRVDVKPAEAARLAQWIEESFDEVGKAAMRTRLEDRVARAEGLGVGEYRKARIPCAFLDDQHRCRAYACRPVSCRVHVSTSEPACRETEGPIPLNAWLGWVGRAIHRGMGDEPLRELHAAVLAALNGAP